MELRTFVRDRFDDVAASIDGDLSGRLRSTLDRLRNYVVPLSDTSLEQLATYLRHLPRFLRLQDALLQYRYVTALLLAVRLGLFEALADGPVSPDALADELDVDPDALETLLSLLEARDVVVSTPDGHTLGAFAADFLAPRPETSQLPFLRMLAEYADAFSDIEEAVRTTRQPLRFDIRHDDPSVDRILDAVNSHLDRASRELLARVDLPRIDHFIVGSAGVSFSANMLRRQRHAVVTYGCLEHLVRRIPDLRQEYGVDLGRVLETHVHDGDPWADQWGREAFDLVFLTKKMILDPANDTGEKFARKAFQVLEPEGVAIFWEAFHDRDGDTPSRIALESLFDIGVTPDAGPLYRDTFRKRLRRIGFEEVNYVDCLGDTCSFAVARRSS